MQKLSKLDKCENTKWVMASIVSWRFWSNFYYEFLTSVFISMWVRQSFLFSCKFKTCSFQFFAIFWAHPVWGSEPMCWGKDKDINHLASTGAFSWSVRFLKAFARLCEHLETPNIWNCFTFPDVLCDALGFIQNGPYEE